MTTCFRAMGLAPRGNDFFVELHDLLVSGEAPSRPRLGSALAKQWRLAQRASARRRQPIVGGAGTCSS